MPILGKGFSLLSSWIRSQTQKEVKSFEQSLKLFILQLGWETRLLGCELLDDDEEEHILLISWLQCRASSLESSSCLMNEWMSTTAPGSFHCLGQRGIATQQYYIWLNHTWQWTWTIRALGFRLAYKLPAGKIYQSCWQLPNCFYFVQHWHKMSLLPALMHCNGWFGIIFRGGPDILLPPFQQ